MNLKKISIIILILLSVSIVSYTALATYIGNQSEIDTKQKSDAILILGARSYIDGEYNPCLESRVVHAAQLYKDGYASKLIVSGGNDVEDNVNEAETMKKIAVERGVLVKDILLEKEATSTYENFVLSQKIMKQNGIDSIVIVTEPFHMTRASLVAEKLEINYTVSPAIESSCWQPNKYFSRFFLKEPFAITTYRLKGQL